ncbi:Ionotropic glutamate receptor domain and Extracellular solute-binding protein, family 3 domain and Glutamate receptor, L-glutamate/glycine-binding domain-containing protein [Strongyloides ratti]|uniref:Ionotropic glutamate receptor domain and Extracellular solute-binding protein, family 3 domain and Glutamate receptor, L-glutamate/glycine-binding domain-containing protein n=1 Tax=Strongyloides ratti TaxID=34506 RepID=A0A090KV86_STRRB|nr:Ionotropic glutamate receptor domain and Extracellular solute-binding protein, family 3 domain and Glutamate receptor, L-glutamate/glycine-binding domain-containing protein [Strongyloides ratti]CEF59755.1 Ionotropic glutamate receptor domain and Extracellular solute-binding protein, family 3 domain and Glutamate receptor, L-glutamate/glycine-binding domain-containing protein [Strongyloides ratti]
MTKIGNWTQTNGWNFDKNFQKTWHYGLDKKEPFVIRADNSIGYEGFCIDLIKEMSLILNFTWTIYEVKDGAYGVGDDNGKWNGVIGMLQRHEADLSVSALTITYSRSSVVDFTLPFMHLGIAILLGRQTDDSQKNTLFTFLEPLSFSVWISLLVAYLVVSCTMWLLARFSPYEWFDTQQIDERDKSMDNHKNQFSLLNSLWFAVGSLMQQGSDVIPRAAATRTVAVIWWMFTLILISTYTAQLAAFLTVERMTTPIESAGDLASQQKIKFGTLRNGSTMDFFRESKIPIYERMWSVMQSNSPYSFVNSSKEGIARVKAGNYAYMMESSMLEYYMEKDCELQTIGGLLDSKGYGIALPKGSPLRHIFSKTVLQLQERTILEALKNKWWKSRREIKKCTQNSITKGSFQSVFGIFYVLLAGLIIAVLLSFGEFCIESRENSFRLELTIPGKLFMLLFSRKDRKNKNKLKNIQLDEINNVRLMSPSIQFNSDVQSALSSLDNRSISKISSTPHKESNDFSGDFRRLSRFIPLNEGNLITRRMSTYSANRENKE